MDDWWTKASDKEVQNLETILSTTPTASLRVLNSSTRHYGVFKMKRKREPRILIWRGPCNRSSSYQRISTLNQPSTCERNPDAKRADDTLGSKSTCPSNAYCCNGTYSAIFLPPDQKMAKSLSEAYLQLVSYPEGQMLHSEIFCHLHVSAPPCGRAI